MITVHAHADLGRAILDLRFRSVARAKSAFVRAGFSDSATLVDDEGVVHSYIDTYEGFWVEGQQFRPSPEWVEARAA